LPAQERTVPVQPAESVAVRRSSPEDPAAISAAG
jgi:hypothetical protein